MSICHRCYTKSATARNSLHDSFKLIPRSIINGDTLEIFGVADWTIIDKNDEYRWIELDPHQFG